MRECSVRVQFCLAHLIREVKFLCGLPDEASRRYGERLREALRALFSVIHQREGLSQTPLRRRLEQTRADVLDCAAAQVPSSDAGRRVAARMEKYRASYFRFRTEPGVEPTNKVAEQAIRFCVIDRHITQGTRGEKG
jgi:hypothetical protein